MSGTLLLSRGGGDGLGGNVDESWIRTIRAVNPKWLEVLPVARNVRRLDQHLWVHIKRIGGSRGIGRCAQQGEGG